jgi:hypothetical protein
MRGALVDWYPYPFLDVDEIGYATALRNTAFVLILGIVLVAIFKRIDRIRTIGAAPQQLRVPSDDRSAADSIETERDR